MSELSQGNVRISSESDIVAARRAVREAATQLHFGVTDVTRIVTAASELARNIFLYAGSGTMQWFTLSQNAGVGIELKFEDHGPGIPDIELAMTPGYGTGHGFGLGLPGTKRLMDEMEIQSRLGKGTTVTVRKWLRR
jgi:serine/threonine-protein kinase RsbT